MWWLLITSVQCIILQNILFNLQSQLILFNPVDANSEKLCETASVSTGVLQHGQRYIYEFLWKTSLSRIGETTVLEKPIRT